MEYWPPITIRCVDGRSFGRDVLVGTCTVDHIERFLWTPEEEKPDAPVYDENGLKLHLFLIFCDSCILMNIVCQCWFYFEVIHFRFQ